MVVATEQTPRRHPPLVLLRRLRVRPGVLPGDLGPGPHRATRFPCPPRPRDFRGQSHVRHRAPFAGIPDESRRAVDTGGPRGHNGGDPPGCNPGWVPEVGGSEPPAEGIHKDTDGPDQASDRVDHLAHLPGRSPVLADLGVTALGLGHGPHLLPGSSLPRQGHWVFREEVPEKARQAYDMGCGDVDTIPPLRPGHGRRPGWVGPGRARRGASSPVRSRRRLAPARPRRLR